MTNKQLERIKEMLLVERKRVLESLHRTTTHTQSEMDDTTRDAGDMASASHDRGLLYRLQEFDTSRLKKIDRVLSRIERDDYGVCQQCEEEIGVTRLEAIPWATLCLSCQEQADLHETVSLRSRSPELAEGQEYDAA